MELRKLLIKGWVGSFGGRNFTGEIAHETVPENETSFVNLSANPSRPYLTYPNQKKDRYAIL